MSRELSLHGFGGSGGAALNFKVIAYGTEEALLEAVPTEGTIGIVTANEITAVVFDAVQPISLLEGAVWIQTGNSSAVPFNALKSSKTALILYPLMAKQYVGGELVSVTARSYWGGTWVAWWTGELYASGEFHVQYSEDLRNGTAEYGDDGVTITTVTKTAAYAYLRFGPVDISRVSAVYATMSSVGTYAADLNLIVTDQAADVTYAGAELKAKGSGTDAEVAVDLSEAGLSGEYYIYVGTEGLASYTAVRQIKLTKAYCVLKE